MTREALLPLTPHTTTNRQRLFVFYLTAILIDLVVLNLFAEYSQNLSIDSFSTSLMAAVLLQLLLRLTIAIEHRVAGYFNARPGSLMTFLRFFCAWLVLFGSKFVILEAITLTFGDSVRFKGAFNGIVPLVIVIVAMLVAEQAIVRLYRWLGDGKD